MKRIKKVYLLSRDFETTVNEHGIIVPYSSEEHPIIRPSAWEWDVPVIYDDENNIIFFSIMWDLDTDVPWHAKKGEYIFYLVDRMDVDYEAIFLDGKDAKFSFQNIYQFDSMCREVFISTNDSSESMPKHFLPDSLFR